MSAGAVGIAGLGVALPYHRIAVSAIAEVWGQASPAVLKRLGVRERGVLDADADTVTLALEAAAQACAQARVQVGAVFVGSQTSPFTARAQAALLVDMLGLPRSTFATDLQFAGKSGTAALAAAIAWVEAGLADAALAVGVDSLGTHSAPGDPRELTAGSGACAMLVTREDPIAVFEGLASVTSDLADGFRLDGERYFKGGGAAVAATGIGDVAHISQAWNGLLARLGLEAKDFAAIACQQPDGALPLRVARKAGFAADLVRKGMVCELVGDLGAASAMTALVQVLGSLVPGERAALLSYGDGAGADALAFRCRRPVDTNWLGERLSRRAGLDYAAMVRAEGRYQLHARPVSAFE